MINLKYSLVIEATDDPTFFGFYSPELEGFTGIGHSIEDCPYQARWGMEEHLATLKDKGLPIPDPKLESYRRHPKRTASRSSGLTAATPYALLWTDHPVLMGTWPIADLIAMDIIQ